MTRIAPTCTAFLALLLALAAPASAGTQDAPELTDDAGDATGCYQAAGNEYADIVSAWISDETATHFNVNIGLNKWTHEAFGAVAGYTLQFTHQGTQFGVLAAYIPEPMGDGWEYGNGFVDTSTGELDNVTDAEGSFTPGAPAVLTIQFAKAHFPHTQSMDHGLHTFLAGSADFKNQMPFFLMPDEVPVDTPPFYICDLAESDAVYEFQVGQHSMGDMAAGEHDMHGMGGDANETDDEEVGALSGPQQGDGSGAKESPGLGMLGLAVAALVAVVAFRRRA